MKKFMTALIFVLVMFGVSYGAELYTVRDVREEMRADIKALEKEMRRETEAQKKEIESIRLDL